MEKKILKHCHLLLMMLAHLRFLPLANHLETSGYYGEVVVEVNVGFDQGRLKKVLGKRDFHTKV